MVVAVVVAGGGGPNRLCRRNNLDVNNTFTDAIFLDIRLIRYRPCFVSGGWILFCLTNDDDDDDDDTIK